MPISFSEVSTRVGQLAMFFSGPYAEAVPAFGEKMDLAGDARVVKRSRIDGAKKMRWRLAIDRADSPPQTESTLKENNA